MREKKIQIINIRNKRRDISIDIKKIKRDYYEQLHAYTFNSLGKINQFLKRQKLPKLTQEELDNMSNNISLICVLMSLLKFF